MSSPTPAEVAAWMRDKVLQARWLDQEDAVSEIERRFGHEFVYDNENGNPAIDRRVLKAFRSMTEDTVVWVRGDRAWRPRVKYDGPGRLAD